MGEIKPAFYTMKEAAQILRLAISTLYDFHHRGIITIKKNGKNNVILRSDVEKYIASIDLTREPNKAKAALRKFGHEKHCCGITNSANSGSRAVRNHGNQTRRKHD